MALEAGEKVKLLEEHIDILKQDLLFLMAERKRKPENTMTHYSNQTRIRSYRTRKNEAK